MIQAVKTKQHMMEPNSKALCKLRSADFYSGKSADMRYNKLFNFGCVTGDFLKPLFVVNRTMNDFGINEMFEMQKSLQEKYKDIWKPICPDRGKDRRPHDAEDSLAGQAGR